VAAVIAVGFVGLAVCLIIICCGVVCLRRYDLAILQHLLFLTHHWPRVFLKMCIIFCFWFGAQIGYSVIRRYVYV